MNAHNSFLMQPAARKLVILVLAIFATAFTVSAILDVAVQAPAIRSFYEDNTDGVAFRAARVPLRDGNALAAFVAFPAMFDTMPARSTPVTILSPGINGRKESMLWKAYNFALNGFVAVAIEARGNGESTGLASFGIDEPADISDTITWVLATYPAINSSKVSLCGQSLGGMFSVLAACKDARVAASAVYHPIANLTSMIAGEFQVAQLIGGFPNFPLDEENLRVRSPITWINATSPRNMLFLHGENDTEVPPSNSLSLSGLANASGHSDTYVIVRPGLNHPANEGDPVSLSLAIAWLDWSLDRGLVPSPGVLWARAAAITIHDAPSGSMDGAGWWLVAAAVVLFLLLFTLLRGASSPIVSTPPPTPDRRYMLVVLGSTLAIAFVIGLLVLWNITSVMWGYLLLFPAAVLAALAAMHAIHARRQGCLPAINTWLEGTGARNWAAGMVSIAASTAFFSIGYMACASVIKHPGMTVFNATFLSYTVVFFMNFAADLVFRSLVPAFPESRGATSHPFSSLCKNSGIILAWRLASVGLVLVFVPVIMYPGIPVSINYLVLIGIPALMATVYFIGSLIAAGTRSRTLVIAILVVILATFLEYRMFRFM